MEEKIVSNNPEVSIADKFTLWKKWFWVGVAISLFNGTAGLIFGIALLTEKRYRREGWIIVFVGAVVTVVNILRLIKLYYPR